MPKLILRESCFTGIENAVTKEIKRNPDHKIFEKQESPYPCLDYHIKRDRERNSYQGKQYNIPRLYSR